MYPNNLQRGGLNVNKLAGKTNRRGPIQPHLDGNPRDQNNGHHGRRDDGFHGHQDQMSYQRPMFNGNKRSYNRPPSYHNTPHEPADPMHEECVRYVADAWYRVQHEFDTCQRQGRLSGVQYYQEKNPIPKDSGFEPFDLVDWVTKRRNLTHSPP